MAMERDLNIRKAIEIENKVYNKEMPFIQEFFKDEGRGRRPRSGCLSRTLWRR